MEIIKKEFFAEGNSILEQAKNVPYDDGVILRDVSYKLKILSIALLKRCIKFMFKIIMQIDIIKSELQIFHTYNFNLQRNI